MKRQIIFIIMFSCLCGRLHAITLDEALDLALENNPAIKSAKYRYESAMAKIPQAGSMDDMWLSYKHKKEDGRGQDAYMISQEIPFPTKLILRSRAAGKEAGSIYNEYLEKENEILSKVKTAFAEIYLAGKVMDVSNESKLILKQAADQAAQKYSTGKAGQQDVLRAQVEIAKIDKELILWEQKRISKIAELNSLLDRDVEEGIDAPSLAGMISALPQITEMYSMAKTHRPELIAAKIMIDKEHDSLSLSKNDYLPDFMVRYEHMENGYEWMAGISLPVWFWQKQNYGVKEMDNKLKTAEAEFKNMENMIFADIKDLYTTLEANLKLKELYEISFIPQAEQSMRIELAGYESGQTDFSGLLDSERIFLEFKTDYYKVLVNLEIATAELEKAVGADLPR